MSEDMVERRERLIQAQLVRIIKYLMDRGLSEEQISVIIPEIQKYAKLMSEAR